MSAQKTSRAAILGRIRAAGLQRLYKSRPTSTSAVELAIPMRG